MMFTRIASMTVLCAAGAAFGQCDPAWDVTPGNPGVGSGYADPSAGWDDGTGEALYIGGSFDRIGGFNNLRGIAKYDPMTGDYSRLGTGISYGNTNGFMTSIMPFEADGENLLVVGGFFSSAGGVEDTQSLAAWDGEQWRSLGAGFVPPQAVWGMTIGNIGDGEKLFFGGGFTEIAGGPASGVASWDGLSLEVVGEGVGMTGFSPFVNELVTWDDGGGESLFVVGRFDTIDGVNGTKLGAVYRPNSGWEPIGSGLVAQSSTTTLDAAIVYDDGNGEALYVAGSPFRPASGGGFNSVFKWDGTDWTPVGQNVGGRVTALIEWDDGSGPALYMSGTATPDINYFARLEGGQWVPYLGGVLGPSISGSWPSVFGMGTFRGDLVVCGNFTRTGDEQASSGVALVAACTGDCIADFNGDEVVDTRDVLAFLNAWNADDESSDINGDGLIDTRDVLAFLNLWNAGC
ncbi:MAG: hypothetical protein HND58_00315 [Planctomycetota bacterium]|nr:MAG: hypothetical protein HND58_00315 [Planctomycetota bacterium]